MSSSRYRLVFRIIVVLLAAAGCLACGVLLALSAPSKERMSLFGAEVCAPTAAVNCDYVLASRWAKIGPTPVSAIGLTYFWAVGMWFLFVGPANHRGRRWHILPLAVTGLGLCGSLGFMFLMAFRLPVWCTWCVATHILNALMFFSVLLSWPWRRPPVTEGGGPERPYPSNVHGAVVVGGTLSLVMLITMGATLLYVWMTASTITTRYLHATNNADYIEWQYRRAPRHEIAIRPDDPAIGPAGAPCTVVVFSDFECPWCAAFFRIAEGLEKRYPGSARFVFKHYPLASACNPQAGRTLHYFACEAALAAEAARSAGTPEQAIAYERLLYANAYRFDARPYQELAVAAGLDGARFAAALQHAVGRDRIDEDIALASKLGVQSTPAIFLDGRYLLDWKIVTVEWEGKIDPEKTFALWSRLLGIRPTTQPTTTSKPAE